MTETTRVSGSKVRRLHPAKDPLCSPEIRHYERRSGEWMEDCREYEMESESETKGDGFKNKKGGRGQRR